MFCGTLLLPLLVGQVDLVLMQQGSWINNE